MNTAELAIGFGDLEVRKRVLEVRPHPCARRTKRQQGETASMINMSKKILLTLAVFALAAVANAKSYSIMLFEPSLIGGTELKPGEYKLELKDEKVVIRSGKRVGEAPVKVENTDNKYASTTVRYSNGDGKYRIKEILLGGTNLRLVVSD
jgi:hypothetical protein